MLIRSLAAVGLMLAVGALPLFAEEGKDTYGDPLPKGAKARLGTERMRLLNGYSAPVLMPDGKSLITVNAGKLQRIDVTTGLAVETLPAAKVGGAITPNVLSADGKRGAGTTYDSISVVELDTGKKLCEIKRRLFAPEGMISLSADGKTLAVGGVIDDKAKDKGVTVQLWNVDEDKEIATCKVAQNNTGRVALSADGKVLATWGYHYETLKPGAEVDPETDPARQVQFWDAAGKLLSTARFGTAVTNVAIAPDGATAAAADGNGSIKLFATKTGELQKQLLGRSRIGRLVQFSADGKALAAAADDGAIQIWNLASGRSAGVAECPAASEYFTVRGMVFPTAERLIALAFRGSSAIVWEAPSGKQLSPAGGLTETPSGLSFVNGDKELLGLASGGQAIRWDLTGKELGAVKLRIPGAPATTAFTSSDRVQSAPNLPMVYRAENSGLGIYDLQTGLQRFSIPSENNYVSNVAFSKDGAKVALVITPGYSAKPKPGRVAVVDLAKGEHAGGFALPVGIIIAAASTADGSKLAVVRRTVAAGKEPQKLFLNAFDTAGGKQICELPLEENYGNFFLAQSPAKDRVILVDPKDGVSEIDLAEGKKARNLTKGTTGLTLAPALSHDGKLIALPVGSTYGAEPATIEVREAESGKLLHKFTGHTRPATALAFSKDGKMLASASSDTTILLWDLTAEKD